MYSYVIHPFTKNAKFDFELWDKHVQIAQRMMDNIVDLEIEKIDNILNKIKNDPESWEIKDVEFKLWTNIKQKAIEGRRTGLGITGEGDTLAALGLIYGTKEATEFAVEIHKQMALSAYTSSIKLAEERGCFPIWDINKDKPSLFLNRIFTQMEEDNSIKILNQYSKTGRRNIALLTIAPTGTTSLLTQTTSGIEPVFLPYYTRRRKTDDKSKASFIDTMGDMWEENFVFHHKYIIWYNINYPAELGNLPITELSKTELEIIYKESPYFNATSNDVNYIEKVKMQGEIQKWIDHSISVTVNMPSNVTEEMVSEVYMTAWSHGCKGITVYRDGSRSGVLVSTESKEDKEEEIIYHKAPKRLEILPVDIYTKTALKKAWTVIVGLLKGKPYEIFAFEQLNNTEFPHNIIKGNLRRVGKSTYQLTGIKGEKNYIINNIILLISQDESLQTKHYSRSLRYGEPIEEITSDIALTANVTSFHKIVERTLKHYIKDGVTEDACPNCGNKLHYESGCKTCKNEECGWSACG